MVLAALPATMYLVHRVDEEIRLQVEKMLADKYPRFVVHVRAARRVNDRGIEVRGLSISDPETPGSAAELVYFDELVIQCNTDWQHLLRAELRANRVILRRPVIRMTRRRDGSWNTDRLLPIPKFSDRPPEITVEGATVEVVDPTGNQPTKLTLRDGSLTVTSGADDEDVANPMRQIKAAALGDHVGRVTLDGVLSESGDSLRIKGTVKGLEISPELQTSLPAMSPQEISWLKSSRAVAELAFRVSYERERPRPLQFQVDGQFHRGRISDRRLPYPLNDVEGRFACDNLHFEIQELIGHNGSTTVRLSLNRQGYQANSPMQLRADCRHLVVDARLRDILSASWRDEWYKYMPSGVVDVALTAAFDGKAWKPNFRIQCRDVAFTYHKFPYRMQRAQGIIEQHDGNLRVNLVAESGTDEVRIDGQFNGRGPDAVGQIQIHGDRLSLNEAMLQAMPAKMREVVSSFQPHGNIGIAATFWRNPDDVETIHRELAITLKGASIRYDRFPYPLSDVHGTIQCLDNQWTFNGFEGVNDTARVTLEGWLRGTPQGPEILVKLSGHQVPLERELRDANRPSIKRLWDDLALRGSIDVAMRFHLAPGEPQADLAIRVLPLGGNTAVEPRFFPYRLEALRGSILYENGNVTLEQIHAQHGRARLTAHGECELTETDGGWHVRFDRLAVDRLDFDRELRAALPDRLEAIVARLNPSGPLNLHGLLDFSSAPQEAGDSRSATADREIEARWDLEFDLHQAAVRFGIDLENINGGVRLNGQYAKGQVRCSGEFGLDSLVYQGVQFTEVRGPLWIDNAQVLFGTEASRRHSDTPLRPLSAGAAGGKVVGDGWVRLSEPATFGLSATLTDGDLSQLAKEVLPGRQQLKGKVLAGFQLGGSGHGRHTLSGRGYVRLSEASIYRLPQMVALLKILSIRSPDTNAFTDSDIDFWIDAGHVYFNRINLNGDAISLIGSGQMNPNGQIGLTFYAMVGRDGLNIPIVGDVFRGASQQFMLIRAEGPWTDPLIRREPFPGINQALEQIQAELIAGSQRHRAPPPVRQPPGLTSRATAARADGGGRR